MESHYDFWVKLNSRIDKTGGTNKCWPWIGSIDRKRGGYGHIWWNGKLHRAHRMVYRFGVGNIPDGMHVLHSCDNPKCCNPEHLSLGTHAENMKQKGARKRGRGASGERHPKAKLTDEQVREIRSDNRSLSKIAMDYGVTKQNISAIKRNKSRVHA